MKSTLLFVAGAKGGTGKSTFLRFLITWLQESGIDPHLLDIDDENATLKRFFESAFTIVPSKRSAYNVLIDLLESGRFPMVLADIKSGVGLEMLNWWSDVPFAELHELGVKLVCVGVVTSSPDSVSSFLRWVNFLGRNVKYAVVRNLKDSDTFNQKPEEIVLPDYDKSKQALEFRKLYKPVEIVMPALDPEYQGELERLNLTIRDVMAKHPNTPPTLSSLMVRSKLRNYQSRLYAAFDANKDLFLP